MTFTIVTLNPPTRDPSTSHIIGALPRDVALPLVNVHLSEDFPAIQNWFDTNMATKTHGTDLWQCIGQTLSNAKVAQS